MPPPDRWLDYCPMGKVIPKTKFVAFKVPLKKALLQGVSENDQFTPDLLMSRIQEQGSKLGMIIDLTFTRKYYNSQDFENRSVLYKKIFVQGAKSGQLVPNDKNFLEFVDAVKGFSQDAPDDQVIGVHCTHGLNRTGYLICRYMIEEMDFEPSEAIALFNEARGHNIERETYLTDLSKREKGVPTVLTEEELNQSQSHHHREENFDWRRRHDDHHGSVTQTYPHTDRVNSYYSNNRDSMTNSRFSNPYQKAGWGTCSHGDYERRRGGRQGFESWKDYDSSRDRSRPSNRSSEYEYRERYSHRGASSYSNSGYSSHREYRRPWGHSDRRRNERTDDRYQQAGWSSNDQSISGREEYGQFGRRDY